MDDDLEVEAEKLLEFIGKNGILRKSWELLRIVRSQYQTRRNMQPQKTRDVTLNHHKKKQDGNTKKLKYLTWWCATRAQAADDLPCAPKSQVSQMKKVKKKKSTLPTNLCRSGKKWGPMSVGTWMWCHSHAIWAAKVQMVRSFTTSRRSCGNPINFWPWIFIRSFFLIGHLHLIGMWFGEDRRANFIKKKKTQV